MANTHLSYKDYIKVWPDKATVTDWVKFNWLGENVFYVDLGKTVASDWTKIGANWVSFILTTKAKSNGDNTPADVFMTDKRYTCVYLNKTFVNYDYALTYDSKLYVRNENYNTAQELIDSFNGVLLFYQPKEPM